MVIIKIKQTPLLFEMDRSEEFKRRSPLGINGLRGPETVDPQCCQCFDFTLFVEICFKHHYCIKSSAARYQQPCINRRKAVY